MSRRNHAKKQAPPLFRKRDLFLIAGVLLAALLCYLWTIPKESASSIVI